MSRAPNEGDPTVIDRASSDAARLMGEMLDAAPAMISIHDDDGRFLYANRRTFEMHGYEASEFMALTLHELDVPEDAQQIAKRIADLDRHGEATFHVRHRRKDGSTFPMHVTIKRATWDGASVVFSVAQDVSERELAAEALRESESRCRTLFETMSQGVVHQDAQGRIISANPAALEILGLTEDEILGRDSSDSRWQSLRADGSPLPGDEHPTMVALRTGKRFGPELFGVYNARTASHRWVMVSAVPLFAPGSSKPHQAYCVFGDFTRQREREERLLSLEAAFEQAAEGIAIASLDGVLRIVNRSFARMHGFEPGELIGQSIAVLHTPAQWREEVEPELARLIEAGTSHGEISHRRRDGTVFPTLMSNVILRNAQGDAVGLVGTFRDITERKRAQDAVERSERRYRELFRSAPVGIYTSTSDGKLLAANPALAQMLGYASPEELLASAHDLGRHFYPRPEDRAAIVERLRREGRLQNFVCEVRARDGASVWIAENARIAAQSPDGTFVIEGFVSDVTDRVRAETAIRESEERYRAVFEAVSEGILIFSSRETLAFGNSAAARIHGLSQRELIHRLPRDFEGSACRDEFLAAWDDAEAGRTRRSASTGFRADGSAFDVVVYSAPLMIADRLHMLCVVRDVTEIRKASEALQSSEARFRHYVEHAPYGVFIADEEGRYVDVNPAACAITGYSAKELLGMSIPDNLAPGSRALGRAHFEALKGGASVSAELEFVRKSGEHGYWSVAGARLSESRFLGFVQDITQRRRAEAEEERLQAQLVQATKMESIGRLAGGVAHDYNNMLGVILGSAELALLQTGEGSALREHLEEIRRAASRSSELTKQLLAFARKQTISPEVLDLNETVSGMLKMLERLIRENVTLAWRPGADAGLVRVDPVQLDQVLVNLVVNARDAIENVGTVTISSSIATLDQSFCDARPGARPGEYVALSVADDGCGMDAVTLGHIFEPFYSTKGAASGTGLGLATVYGVVKQNDGFIDVVSRPGEGATFTIYLPRMTGTAAAARARAASSECPGGSETLLVVEDDGAVLRLVTRLCQGLGYTVLPASSAMEALAHTEAHPETIALVVSDVVMPGMSGRDLWERLRGRCPQAKCLFISGYTADVIAFGNVLGPGVNFLQKPFSMSALAAKIRDVLDS